MNELDVINYLDSNDYDLRVSGNARWIDQKCTPDVLWSVSDFILNYIDNVTDTFTVADIWQSDYAKQTIKETFSKPGTDDKSAENEYDKVFSQPINLLCYAGILEDINPGTRHLYIVKNQEVLEYIARNDVYTLRFLQAYIEKVLRDSNMYRYFETFFNLQTKNSFTDLKQHFVWFYHKYTPVKGEYEPKRIFTKVLNPLALKYGKCGTERGNLSKYPIIRSDIMYNRDNFRDVFRDKPKGIARKDWLAQHPEIDVRDGYFEQQMAASKRLVKLINDNYRHSISELTQFDAQQTDTITATQMHHIFPKNEFPTIMHYAENIIALTPNQHFNFAHPNNNTQVIDLNAQKVLLTAKTYSIKKNIEEEQDVIYSFDNLLFVLKTGWDDENVLNIYDNDYMGVVHCINYHY